MSSQGAILVKKIIRAAAVVVGVVAMALAAGADITWPWW